MQNNNFEKKFINNNSEFKNNIKLYYAYIIYNNYLFKLLKYLDKSNKTYIKNDKIDNLFNKFIKDINKNGIYRINPKILNFISYNFKNFLESFIYINLNKEILIYCNKIFEKCNIEKLKSFILINIGINISNRKNTKKIIINLFEELLNKFNIEINESYIFDDILAILIDKINENYNKKELVNKSIYT